MRVDDLDKSPQREEHMSPCYVCIGMELLRSTIRAHGTRAPNGLTDRVKLHSCERPEARGGRILDVFDRRATKGRDANVRFHDGRQTVRCSRWAGPSPGVRVCEASTGCGLVPIERGLT